MKSVMQGERSRRGMLGSAGLFAVALVVASCTSSEVSAGKAQPATTSLTKTGNPCAAKNPCATKAANPCAAKNPCAAGSKVDPTLVTRPAGTKLFAGQHAQLRQDGERLWQDRTLGQSGLACGTCHLDNANFNATFVQPYPHMVAMPLERSGVQQVTLDEMVQFCMVVPMASKPLAWESKELAALTAYSQEVQKGFIRAAAANPCMLKQKTATNPCNPCAAKAKNPCNPCAAKNPTSH